MRCSVYECINNGQGYCYDKDFVSINDQGKCNHMHLRERSYSNVPTYTAQKPNKNKISNTNGG